MKRFIQKVLNIVGVIGILGGIANLGADTTMAVILLISSAFWLLVAQQIGKSITPKDESTSIADPQIIEEPIATPQAKPTPVQGPPVEDLIKCPKCGSSQFTHNKKGFGAGKALTGALLTGGIGLLGGFIGSGKIKLTCLACGKKWKPGKA